MKNVCVIVPAHNEGKVIATTIQSLLDVFDKKDIYIVDDGSDDTTTKIAKKYIPNVLKNVSNIGKAASLNAVIAKFRLAYKYKYILLMDSDTVIAPDFLTKVLPVLDRDKKEKIVAVVGRVAGRAHNWMTLYRIWEYEIAQSIHKSAQDKTGSIVVCPGCSTVYRAAIFQKLSFPEGTLTEDMDLTFLIHRQKIGRIAYVGGAAVTTQDPQTFKDFLLQVNRWYTGFWQNIIKHEIPWHGQRLDGEVALLALEGLFNGLLVATMLLLGPYLLLNSPMLIVVPFLVDLLLFLLPTIAFVIIKFRHYEIIKYLPFFYVVRTLSSLMFIASFIKVAFGLDIKMSWYKAGRYKVA